jgi:aldose 1-epimerase
VTVITLENDYWHAGILPETGASIAFGRIRHGDRRIDVLRPTPTAEYGNPSKTANFIMLPWVNRIRDGILRFAGRDYQLRTETDDGTARHGDVRKRAWRVEESSPTSVRLSFDSSAYPDVNFPFTFRASVEYALEDHAFVWRLSLANSGDQPFPAGFGFHPYFVRRDGVEVNIPCQQEFDLVDYLATDASKPITPRLDFRELRPLGEIELNDLLTGRIGGDPARIYYPNEGIEVQMYSDPVYRHILLFAPHGESFLAVEPMTMASDGFNLYERGITESGVFVVQSGETVTGEVRLEWTEVAPA